MSKASTKQPIVEEISNEEIQRNIYHFKHLPNNSNKKRVANIM